MHASSLCPSFMIFPSSIRSQLLPTQLDAGPSHCWIHIYNAHHLPCVHRSWFSLLVSGLNCYQCNSTLDHNCQEFFNHNNPNQQMVPTQCQMYAAKYCIKVTGLWGGTSVSYKMGADDDICDQAHGSRRTQRLSL